MFCAWHREHLNSKVGRQKKQGAHPDKYSTMEVMAHVAMMCHATFLFNDGPTVHWVGPETLVSFVVEGREVKALANSGNQVNTVMPSFVCQHEFPVLPLGDLVDYPRNLIGLGGTRMRPMGFMILQVQVTEISSYDENVIFLVVTDESGFSQHVPLVIGTCTLGRIMKDVIKESDIDRLSTPWVIARTSSLLSKQEPWHQQTL